MADLVSRKKNPLYEIMAVASGLIRQFCLSNPFEALGEGLQVTIEGNPIVLHPEVLNLIASLFLPTVTYLVVNFYYQKGSNPALGSFLYLVFFIVHNWLLKIMCGFGFTKLAVCIVGGVYILCHVGFNSIKQRFM